MGAQNPLLEPSSLEAHVWGSVICTFKPGCLTLRLSTQGKGNKTIINSFSTAYRFCAQSHTRQSSYYRFAKFALPFLLPSPLEQPWARRCRRQCSTSDHWDLVSIKQRSESSTFTIPLQLEMPPRYDRAVDAQYLRRREYGAAPLHICLPNKGRKSHDTLKRWT
jgi:hypothetical protein